MVTSFEEERELVCLLVVCIEHSCSFMRLPFLSVPGAGCNVIVALPGPFTD